MLNDVNYNFRNTEVCMYFDPKLCLKSNNLIPTNFIVARAVLYTLM